MLRFAAAFIATLLLVPGISSALHLGALAIASTFFRSRPYTGTAKHTKFLVVIPAHNEELLIRQTLTAVNAAKRPGDQVIVVDDRSEDQTGAIAADCGATVVRRETDQEPGRAAARQAGILASHGLAWDAMVMIDADSIIDIDFFTECEIALSRGQSVLQCRSEAAVGHRMIDQFALASFAMQGVMLPRGREVLRLPVRLRGTGMVFRRDVLHRLDFRARASEDLQVTLDLIRSGVRIRHVDRARLRSANADSWKTAATQKQRYEAGRMASIKNVLPMMLRSRGAFEMGWYVSSPPFAVAVGLCALATMIGLAFGYVFVVFVGLLGVGLLAFAIIASGIQARLSPRILLALLLSPLFISWKLVVQVRALVGLRGGLKEFGATPRGK